MEQGEINQRLFQCVWNMPVIDMHIPGHGFVLHCLVSVSMRPVVIWSDNRHSVPLYIGAGLSQDLFLDWNPPPQVTLHSVNSVQFPNEPLTKKWR